MNGSNVSPRLPSINLQQSQRPKSLPQVPSNDSRFQSMIDHLRQYNEIEVEEKKLLNNKIQELKEQLQSYKRQASATIESSKADGDTSALKLTGEEKRRIVILQNESKTLKFQIKTMELDKEILLKESNDFKQEIQNLKKEKFDKITEVTDLKVQIQELEAKIAGQLQVKIRNYKKLIKNLKLENDSLVRKNELLEMKVGNLEQLTQELLLSNNGLKEENFMLQQSLIENLEKLKALTLENDRLRNQGDDSESDNSFSNYHKLPIRSQKHRRVPSRYQDHSQQQQQQQIHLQQQPQCQKLHSSAELRYRRARRLPSNPLTNNNMNNNFDQVNNDKYVPYLNKSTNTRHPTVALSPEPEILENKKLLSVRVLGRQLTLKQCFFKFQVSEYEDTMPIFRKVCIKYAAKYGLDLGGLEFRNYKGDLLSVSDGYPVTNGDIIYVNYK